MTAAPIPWSAATDLVFLAEQVSHHPPVSAFYAECQARNISFTGHIYTKSVAADHGIGAAVTLSAGGGARPGLGYQHRNISPLTGEI